MNKKVRESNIELLRIFAMIIIVAHHFALHSNFNISQLSFLNKVWIQLLLSGGKIGVNIFLLISGYFLISSDRIKVNKLLKLVFQMLFYSLILYVIFACFNITPFSVSRLVNHALCYPVWWFAKGYLFLYLLHPYINKLLNSFEKNEFKKYLIFLTVILSIIPTITSKKFDDGFIIWFIYIYSIGAYLKKFPLTLNWKSKKYIFISIILYILTFSTVIITDIAGQKFPSTINHATYVFSIEKISVLLISIFLFIGFSNMKIKNSNIINVISSSMFGIYLIHDCDCVRNFLWNTLFKSTIYSCDVMLIPYSIFVIIIVFISCSLIELLRIFVLEKNYMKLVEKIINKVSVKKIKIPKIFENIYKMV